MEWWSALLLIFGSLIVLLLMGVPVALAFITVNVAGIVLFTGSLGSLQQLIISMFRSVATFTLLPVPLFILMGEVLFHSGLAPSLIDALDKWLGRLPGRLGLLAVASGTLFATLSGSSVGSTAMLGAVLVPEMERRGYKKPMSLGPIMGSGSLAAMIPPSAMAVMLAGLGNFSVGGMLMAIIIPGLLMSSLYATYIIIRCYLQPAIAPPYEVPSMHLSQKIIFTVKHVLPLGVIVFLVIGVIFLGIATPSEAAATGTLGCFVLASLYRRLNWEMVKRCMSSTLRVAGMVFLIATGALTFSQILAYSGASEGLVASAIGLPLAPVGILIVMQLILLVMGCFMDAVAIMMITLPIYMPIIHTLGFDPVWFGVMMLINFEVGTITPPFGILLFVMKGVATPDTTVDDIIRAGVPFIALILIVLALVMAFPILATWLPSAMISR